MQIKANSLIFLLLGDYRQLLRPRDLDRYPWHRSVARMQSMRPSTCGSYFLLKYKGHIGQASTRDTCIWAPMHHVPTSGVQPATSRYHHARSLYHRDTRARDMKGSPGCLFTHSHLWLQIWGLAVVRDRYSWLQPRICELTVVLFWHKLG